MLMNEVNGINMDAKKPKQKYTNPANRQELLHAIVNGPSQGPMS